MILILLCFTICAIIIIAIYLSKAKKKRLEAKAFEMQSKYPRAYRIHEDYSYHKETYSKWRKYIERPESEWEKEEQQLQEQERKRQDLERRYNEIVQLYPDGLKKWGQLNPYSTREQIVSNVNTISHYDRIIKEAKEFDKWENEQENYTITCLNIGKQTMASFGWYHYDIPFRKKDELGSLVQGKYKVCQFFAGSYCLEEDLDYSDFKNIKERTGNLNEFKNCERFYKSFVYEKIKVFIEQMSYKYGNISVYLCANNEEWDVPSLNYHYAERTTIFDHFSITIEITNPASDALRNDKPHHYDNYPVLKYRHIIIVDMQTENWQLKDVCKNIIEKNNANHPLITYISLLKGFDREEMQTLINREKSKKAEEEKRQAELAKYKTDKIDIIKLLNDNSINCFYHFTSAENLDSIRKYGGLYSWWSLEQRNINVPFLGGKGVGQDLDRKYGLQDYVRLSFCDDHPMQYKHRQDGVQLILLQIDTEVATWRDTLFSDINATDNDHQCGGTLADLQKVNFEAVKKHFVSRGDADFKPHQAEILVKTFIPVNYIKNIDSPLYL
ncbi:MAG: DUF4433 domain-containing protein [Salinivirgaceae bacterium]|nr:DUF4433 domain-containing protein [Salinivirgaceae bacterium]